MIIEQNTTHVVSYILGCWCGTYLSVKMIKGKNKG